MNFLDSINSDFNAYGICDKRIPIEPENRTRSTEFGGVAIMWRKELHVPVFPVERECTDRVILAVAKCRNVYINIIGVLLPSTNQTLDEFRHTLEHIIK